MFQRLSYCALVLCLPLIVSVELPPIIRVCQRSNPDLAQCVKQSIELIRPKLGSGDLGNGFVINSLEPIELDDIIINRGDGLFMHLSNLRATGASKFQIQKLRINIEHFRIDALVEIPRVEAVGHYQLKMNLGVLNLNGEGTQYATLDRLRLKISFYGSMIMKGGEEYVRVDSCKVNVKIVEMKMNFEGLFKNDKVLNDLGNSLVNQNVDLFIKDVEPSLESSLSKKFLTAASQVLEKAPFKVFLP